MHQIEQFYDFGVTGAVLQLVLQVLQFYSLKQCQKSRSCSPFSMDDDVAASTFWSVKCATRPEISEHARPQVH